MIHRFKPTPDQEEYAGAYLKEGSIAHRGEFDGDYKAQFIGVLGKVILSDFLKLERPVRKDQSLKDFFWNGKSWNVNVVRRNVPYRNHYAHNVVPSQLKYPVDGFIFFSYNQSENYFELCGYVLKEDFLTHRQHFSKGESIKRDDGSSLTAKGSGGISFVYQRHIKEFEVNDETH